MAIAYGIARSEIANLGAAIRVVRISPDDMITGSWRPDTSAKSRSRASDNSPAEAAFSMYGPAGADLPVRIEFFGDTVDSIREFDVESQLSIRHLDETAVAPMREFATSPNELNRWADAARKRFPNAKFDCSLRDRTDFADEGETFSGWEFLLPIRIR